MEKNLECVGLDLDRFELAAAIVLLHEERKQIFSLEELRSVFLELQPKKRVVIYNRSKGFCSNKNYELRDEDWFFSYFYFFLAIAKKDMCVSEIDNLEDKLNNIFLKHNSQWRKRKVSKEIFAAALQSYKGYFKKEDLEIMRSSFFRLMGVILPKKTGTALTEPDGIMADNLFKVSGLRLDSEEDIANFFNNELETLSGDQIDQLTRLNVRSLG